MSSLMILSLASTLNASHRRVMVHTINDRSSIRGNTLSYEDGPDLDAIKEVYLSLGVPRDLMSTQSYCDWAGIKCSPSLNVISINLFDVELHGTISPLIGDLQNLKEIVIVGMDFLKNGDIHGSLPREIGKLTQLETLSMSGNKLSGSLPNEIGSLTSLTYLSLSDNSISGPIPRDIGKLHKLVWLGLDSNQLTGPVPEEMEYLTELGNVGFFDNEQLSGTPSFLCNVSIFDYAKTAIPENLCDMMTPYNIIG